MACVGTGLSGPPTDLEPPGLMASLERWTQRGWRCTAIVIFVGVALHAATLFGGFAGDDYVQQMVFAGGIDHPTLRPWSLYDFGHAPTPEQPGGQTGFLPWWTDSDWYLRFIRPVTSLTVWADYAIYGNHPMGYHLTSLILFGLLLWSCHGLYRRLGLSPPAAVLAVLLLAVEDSTIFPVGWIANRNSLLAVLLTVVAVRMALSCDRRFVSRFAAALLAAVLACGAKESGVTAFVLVAWALIWRRLAEKNGLSRIKLAVSLAVCGVLAVGFICWLAFNDVGTNSAAYAPPWSTPGRYLRHLGLLLTAGPLALIGPIPLALAWLVPTLALPMAAVGVLVATGLVLWARRLIWDWVAVFFVGWIAISVLPQAGAPLADRLLFGAAVGSVPLLAKIIVAAWNRHEPTGWVTGHRVAAGLLISAGVLSLMATVGFEIDSVKRSADARRGLAGVAVTGPNAGSCEIVALQMPAMQANVVNSLTYWIETGDRRVRIWPMQFDTRRLVWTRIDDRTFELESPTDQPPLVNSPLEDVFRTTCQPPAVGKRWRTAAFDVEAAKVDIGGLRAIRVRMAESLDSAMYRFVVPSQDGWHVLIPPSVGQSTVLDRPS